MADLKNTYKLTSYHPNVDWKVDYSQTGRTSTSATYKFTVSMTLKTGLSYGYGYDIYLHLSQGGTTKVSRHQLKTTANVGTSWSTSFNVTLDTDSNGGNISSVKLWSTSDTDATHSQQQLNVTGEVTKTTYGTAPGVPTNVSASGFYEAGEKINVTWSASSGAKTYHVQYNQYDDVTGWAGWGDASASATGTTLSHSITSVGTNRSKVKYRVRAKNDIGYSDYSSESNEILRSGIKVYNGSFVRGKIKVWNGSAWVNARVRVYDGSSFVNAK